jgi:hypothetical protein
MNKDLNILVQKVKNKFIKDYKRDQNQKADKNQYQN